MVVAGGGLEMSAEQIETLSTAFRFALLAWGGLSLVVAVALWFSGVLPVVLRLGFGLTRRKVAIFARDANLLSLQSLLTDSKLFKEKRILGVPTIGDLGRMEEASVLLLQWSDWGNDIESVLAKKADNVALIIHALPGTIPPLMMERLNTFRNVGVTNFRGRLLNDLITCLITTGYEKR
jgi:hypothetical protein